MPKGKKYKTMTAVMNMIMEDGSLKPLMTFTFDVPSNRPDTMVALSLITFEEDIIKQHIKFEYSEVENGNENRNALVQQAG